MTRWAWCAALLLAGCRTPPVEEPPDLAPAVNACGGHARLAYRPGDPCGACGEYRCAGVEALECVEGGSKNACGDCGPLPEEQCNGYDDDCDGQVDEGCALRIGLLGESAEIHVRVSGDRIALDVVDPSYRFADVALLSLPGAKLEVLTPHMGADADSQHGVELDGPLLAWVDDGRAVAYDASSQRRFAPSGGPGTVEAVDVDGRHVALQAGTPARIYLWDVDRDQVVPLTDGQRPALAGDWLAFERPRGGGGGVTDVFARRLSNGEERNLSAGMVDPCVFPAIDGERVVWAARRKSAEEADTWLYDLSKGERRQLSDGTGRAYAPRISGDLVCWWRPAGDDRWGRGVWVHDLGSGRELLVAPNGGWCDLSGRRLVWSEPAWSFDGYYRDLLPNEP